MPNGALSPDRKIVRSSATPSPSASRSSERRFLLGAAPPAFFWYLLKNQPLIPLLFWGRGGAFVSATRTSPLGRTYTQRGCSSPCAKAATAVPCAACRFVPGAQPFAFTTLITGISDRSSGGKTGWGPVPALTGSRADAPQAAALNAAAVTSIRSATRG